MLHYYLLFFFVTVIAKFILALITIYLLLPSDPTCSHCDGGTILLVPTRWRQAWSVIFLGRVGWRWCPRCNSEGMARRGKREPSRARTPADQAAHTRN